MIDLISLNHVHDQHQHILSFLLFDPLEKVGHLEFLPQLQDRDPSDSDEIELDK